MKRKGSILLEGILGIFYIGLLATCILPLLGLSFNNVKNIRSMDEMVYIGEMVGEKLKSKSNFALKTVADLEASGEILYEDGDFDTSKYRCKLVKVHSSQGFIEYMIIVEPKGDINVKPVEFKSSAKW